MKYDLKGHSRSYKTTFMPNHSSTFVYGPIFMKICMNANIMKTQYMTLNITFMLWRSPSNLNTTFTYVLMDIFCPCLM